MTHHEIVRTEDGRDLEVRDTGPVEGFPLVYHHGTPQGAVPFPTLERAAADLGLRVISYSRPGYGSSSPRPNGATTAQVADDATDTATVLDSLGVGEFLTIGWSGGGPRALACAALLPGRCLAAACCVGIAPAAEYDGDNRDGMAEENLAEYTAAFAGVEALEEFLETQTGFFTVSAEDVAAGLGALAPPVDRAALDGEMAEYLAASVNAAGRQGIVGWRDDDLTHTRPWGFDLRKICSGLGLAGPPGRDGAVRPRTMVGGERRRRPGSSGRGRGAPLPHPEGPGDPRRSVAARWRGSGLTSPSARASEEAARGPREHQPEVRDAQQAEDPPEPVEERLLLRRERRDGGPHEGDLADHPPELRECHGDGEVPLPARGASRSLSARPVSPCSSRCANASS